MVSSSTYKCGSCSADFVSLDLLKEHHKTPWHRYNLKRKLAEKPPISLDAFTRKLTLLQETGIKAKGTDHLKKPISLATAPVPPAGDVKKTDQDGILPAKSARPYLEKTMSERDSLFDSQSFSSLEENISYMEKKYSLYIPNREYLVDLPGLIKYLGQKVSLGHQCLFCNRPFQSTRAVQNHMISKGHTSIGTHTEEQMEELESYYDYSESYRELNLPSSNVHRTSGVLQHHSDTDEGWETDNDDDDDDEDEEHRDSSKHDFEQLLLQHGLKRAHINDIGNLILPNGSEVAHRSLAYVYRQRHSSRHDAPCIRLALQQAKQKRALAQIGDFKMNAYAHNGACQTAYLDRARQRFDLRIGTKNNKLQRIIRRAEKYFI